MKKIKALRAVDIKEGMFFPEDFKKLNPKTVIFIKSGKLIPLT